MTILITMWAHSPEHMHNTYVFINITMVPVPLQWFCSLRMLKIGVRTPMATRSGKSGAKRSAKGYHNNAYPMLL